MAQTTEGVVPKAMAGALGFEPRNFLIQSQAPYQLGHAPAVRLSAGTVYHQELR